jgi:CRISPR-associated endonuclease/helicase Cas3
VLSLGFLDWLFPRGHADRDAVLAMIACHHKDASQLFGKYGGAARIDAIRDDSERESIKRHLTELADNITLETRDHLWHWIDQCAHDWATALGFTLVDPPTLIPQEQARASDLGKAIFAAMRDLYKLYGDRDNPYPDPSVSRAAHIMRGLILTADHSASAGVTEFPPMPLTRAHAERPLTSKSREMLDHQQAAADTPRGSAILIAPTASGKTEAALLWAAQQMEARPAMRLFYALPYQASMNAMYLRLATEVLGCDEAAIKAGTVETICIRHSRALLMRYQLMMEIDEREPKDAEKQARWLKNKAELNVYPIQVFSPYQMLKAAYALKGYETLLLDYTDALFIFDEIHAYEPKRLALIIEMMRWLREHYGARFFVMTATLPPMLRDRLVEALDAPVIAATPSVFTRSQRHVVSIVEGRVSDTIVERVRADWAAGKAVLVCLNQIASAQEVYKRLRDELGLQPDEAIVLLHGRFNGRDRRRKEARLMERAGVGRAERRPFVCVATQVVEVSLNVDFDTLYTEPAPLEALLQRFGRVNRGRGAGSPLLDVHVFTQPDRIDVKMPYMPYDQALVERGLAVLRAYCGGKPIDESLVTTMLGDIYTGDTLDAWHAEYQEQAKRFKRDIIGGIKAMESGEVGRFYELFDGREVLPTPLVDAYYDARERGGYLAASQYLVNITHRLYGEFYSYNLITPAQKLENEYADHIHVVYDPEYGLDIEGARRMQKNADLDGSENEGD